MAYVNAKATRIYVSVDWVVADGAPASTDPGALATDGWVFVGGVRSDSASNTANTQSQYHYGEADAVTTSAPADRTFTIPVSEDPADAGQKILRWANRAEEQIGVLMLKDGSYGYAVEATIGAGEESGDAQGGLRAASFTINPLSQRVAVGTTDEYVPTP
jgi:hypothetical protein